MSSLDRQQASFASSISAASQLRGPVAGTKRTLAPPSPSPSVGSTTSAAAGGMTPRKDRTADRDPPNVVYSQPATTGTGESTFTQLTYAIKWLRGKDEPQTLNAVLGFLSTAGRGDQENEELVTSMRSSNSIEWIPDPDLSEQTWRTGTYRHRAAIPNVRDKEALLRYLQNKTDASPVGVKELKDGWPDCEKAINELEAEHRLLVVRHKKDNVPRYVWLDDPSLFNAVDNEFRTIWLRHELPAPEDMYRKLESLGQEPTSEDPRVKLANQAKVEKKKTKRTGKSVKKWHNLHVQHKFDPNLGKKT